MDDLISRQSVIDEIWKLRRNQQLRDDSHNADLVMHGLYLVEKVVEKLPSAQTDIITCGDCKHWICHDKRCGYWNHGVKPLDWCCHAEPMIRPSELRGDSE